MGHGCCNICLDLVEEFRDNHLARSSTRSRTEVLREIDPQITWDADAETSSGPMEQRDSGL